MGRKYEHLDINPTQEVFNRYMNRIKAAKTFDKKVDALVNAETNRNVTAEMLLLLHQEAYKYSPSWAKAQKANAEINMDHPKREAK